MNKEQILDGLKDLIQTMRSPNFEDPEVKKKWAERYERVTAAMDLLSPSELRWMDKQYKTWLAEIKVKVSLDI